jgi:arylsulfatase A-like enzyme
MRKSDIFVIAAWSAVIFGLVEGLVLVICRAYPANVAPYKVSNDALWVAPVLDLIIFLLVAAGMLLLMKLGRKWLNGMQWPIFAYGAFIFLGIFAVISVPKIIHLLSAAVLSLGLSVAFCRKLSRFESGLTAFLRRRLMWIPVLIVTVALGVSGYDWVREFWLFRQLPVATAGAVNVLVIVLDTVRYDRFTHPPGHSLTPRLDQITAKGVSFENAWSTTSWSLPSQASILTGRYPHEHGADWPRLQLGEKYPTLGEFFARHGYVTGAFSGNASWVTPEYLGRGFLRFEVYRLEDILRRTAYGRPIDRLLGEIGYHYAGRGKKAPKVNAQFLKFLDDYPDRPFFAYLCYMDVNQAFHNRQLNRGFWTTTPSEYEVIQAYDGGLKILDQQIGDLFTELARRRILDKSLVIITSDHGESFGAQSTDDHDPAGHGTSLYPEQTKVPLFVIYPDKIPDARKVKVTVSLRQIPKTITQILNMADSPFVGQALPVALESIEALEDYEAHVLATLNYDNQEIQSVICHPWQYINNRKHPGNGEELYDLAADPLAKENLAPNHLFMRPMRDRLQQLSRTSAMVSTNSQRAAEIK